MLAALVWVAMTAPAVHAQSCTATAVAPVFGSYSSGGGDRLSNGSVTVACTVLGTVPLSVVYSVNIGLGTQADGLQRKLLGSGQSLNYNLFCDSSLSRIWVDGLGGSCSAQGGNAALLGNLLTVFPVYGKLPGGQTVPAGAYSNALTVQVLY